MQKLILIAFLAAFEINAKASLVYASDYGWNASDATIAFQTAIRSSADTIIIDKQNGDWITGPNLFVDLSDKTIIFQPGVVLKAKPGAFPENGDCLFELVRANQIKIIGYGAIFQMNKAEYAAMGDGEWRHSLAINNSSNIEVFGLRMNESGGDGVYISGDPWHGEQLYSENILLKDLWCDKQYRQGISVISAQHLHVINCWFTNTSGTLPMSGVDLEPDNESHRMVDVIFDKCRFTGNYGNGIQLSFGRLTSSSAPVNITFRDCYSSANHDISNTYTPAEIVVSAADREAVTGEVTFDRCLVEKSSWTAVHVRKPADSFISVFNDCVFLDVSKEISNIYNTPLWIEVTDYYNPCPRFGGVVFNDCLISYNTDLHFLGSYGEASTSAGMGNVKLNRLTVINPNPNVSYDATSGGGSPDTTCRFDYNTFTTSPATSLNFTAYDERIIECSGKNSTYEAMRISENKNIPVAATYSIEGNGIEGQDFSRTNGFLIIPSLHDSRRDTIYVLKDEYNENAKCIFLSLDSNPLFTSSSNPQLIFVWDCITAINDITGGNKFSVFPNPVHDFVEIDTDEDYQGPIQVFNERGQMVLNRKANDKVNIIDATGLRAGIYIIMIQIDNKIHTQKIIKL
jgi:hypothetical protein